MKLKQGDQVFLVAPGGFIKNRSIVDKTVKLLKKWGLHAKTGKHIFKRQGAFAGSDNERLEDLQTALDDPQTKMIWALRGGYGTNRILDSLEFSGFKKNPKIIAGFSDITLLHNKIQKEGFPSWHTLMPVNLDEQIDEEVLKQTYNAFFGKPLHYKFDISPYNKGNFTKIKAPVTGGNLAILYSTLGTPWEVDTRNKILMIEDVGEQLYQIDRMIISMKKAGKFDKLKALLVGQFTSIPENQTSFEQNIEEIILQHTGGENFPVIFNFPVGHIPGNYPVILGKDAVISAENNQLSFSQ